MTIPAREIPRSRINPETKVFMRELISKYQTGFGYTWIRAARMIVRANREAVK